MAITRSQTPRRNSKSSSQSAATITSLPVKITNKPLKVIKIVKSVKHEPRISPSRPSTIPQPPGLTFQLQPAIYGVIQERVRSSLYALCVQAVLWNQTHGLAARPVLFTILATYPEPELLAVAPLQDLVAILQPIGLQNTRAARLIALAQAWVAAPPCKERRYRKLHYPNRGCGVDIKPGEILECEDPREGWEIAHLPGMGPYAIDSYRIFYRDTLRDTGHEPGTEEWRRVVPLDKDLRAYLQWKWAEDGWDWDPLTGKKHPLHTG